MTAPTETISTIHQVRDHEGRVPDAAAIRVAIRGVDMGIWDLTVLMVKLAIAAIPAGIVVAVIWSLVGAFVVGIMRG